MMQGLVTKSTGSWYAVQTADGRIFECRIKGKFRIKGLVTTNPIAVGDQVDFEMEPEQETGVITNLHQRKNYIIRKSINLSKQAQVIAANLDQALLVVNPGIAANIIRIYRSFFSDRRSIRYSGKTDL